MMLYEMRVEGQLDRRWSTWFDPALDDWQRIVVFLTWSVMNRPLVGLRRSIPAGLLQATSLSFIVLATQIGRELCLMTKATGAALVAAGLLSVLIFPVLALTLLSCSKTDSDPTLSQWGLILHDRQQKQDG
jgi:hypothetical protein